MNSLKKQALRSGKHVASLALVEKAVALVQLLILARLLNPEAFGVFALAMALVIAGSVFTSLGTERILIQRASLNDGFVGSAWLTEIGRGALVSTACFLLAPLYAEWMRAPELENVLYLLMLIPFFASLQTPALTIAERDLKFGKVVSFQIASSAIQLLILSGLAYVYPNVYALAIGFTVMALVRSVLSWFWFGVSILPSYTKKYVIELFGLGKHYFVIALGGYAMTQGDTLIVGNILGAVVLGYYVMAYQISQWPVDILGRIVGRVAFPVFSRLQEDTSRLNRAFDQVLQIQLLFLVPVVVALFLFSPLIIPVLLGSAYTPSIVILQAMILIIVGRGMSHLLDPFIIGAGYVSFASKVKIFETSVFLISVWYGVHNFGVEGAAIGAGMGYLFAALVRIVFVCYIVKYSVLRLFKRVSTPLFAALLSALPIIQFELFLEMSDLTRLLLEATIFALIYIFVSVLLDRTWVSKLKELLQQ